MHASHYKDRLISSGRATSNNLRLTLMLLLHEVGYRILKYAIVGMQLAIPSSPDDSSLYSFLSGQGTRQEN